jgi:hypothetical protein
MATRSPKHIIEDDGLPDAIGPHGEGPPSRGRVDRRSTDGGEAPLNFDDDEIYSGRGNTQRTGGTTPATGGDSGRLGPPSEQLSDSNLPSDPDTRRDDKR